MDSFYPTLGIFDGKDPMGTFGFLATICNAFDDQGMSEDLATRALGFFVAEEVQRAYHNVLYPGTEDPLGAPQSWALVVNTLLSRFLTDDLLRKEHQAVLNAKNKRGDTEIA